MSIGLFGTLGMAARSLQVQQAGIEVAGNNMSNVTNPAYARQILNVATADPVATAIGLQGTGVQAVGIQQVRSQLVDSQIQSENSVSSYWLTQQQGLEFAQADLGQQISSASSTSSTTAGQDIASSMASFFSELQNLSSQPTSMAERQVLLMKAGTLAGQFNQVAQRLDALRTSLNTSLQTDVGNANQLLNDIAGLNDQIITSEVNTGSPANDLRDLRQQKIEDLSKLANLSVTQNSNGGVNITIGGVMMVSDKNVLDTMQTYDAGGGQLLVKATTANTPLAITGGSIAGEIDTRDGAVATLANSMDTLASQLISAVNAVHTGGYSLTGSTGAKFFSGADAHTIALNSALLNNPALIQASGTNGAVGDNSVALAMAQLATQTNAGLNNQTFSQAYNATVATLGQSLATTNDQVTNQQTVLQMLQKQRSSISGVSLDEEMANLSIYQHAYEASAHLISVVDQMLDTLINIQ
jgi:flagellar hook-associated protein 1 FlgK